MTTEILTLRATNLPSLPQPFAREIVLHVADRAAERCDAFVDLRLGDGERRRQNDPVAERADHQAALAAALEHAFGDAPAGWAGRLRLLVRDAFDTDHEMAAAHVADQVELAE